jgi:hypothetical protein
MPRERPHYTAAVKSPNAATAAPQNEETDVAKTSTTAGRISRRSMLKTAASVAGLAAGSRAITGFPAVHAQEPKVLRYLGTAVN